MAEIKSALEIALQRAAAMDRESGEADLEEGKRQGGIAARRFLNGNIDSAGLATEIASLPAGQEAPARREAASALIEATLAGHASAGQGLAALAPAGRAESLAGEIEEAARTASAQAAAALLKLAREMAESLAGAGISGPAVKPNPQAHSGYAEAMGQAKAASAAVLHSLVGEMLG